MAKQVNWISIAGVAPGATVRAEVKIRNKHAAAAATLCGTGDAERVEVRFDEPQRAVTPGQGAVFYEATSCSAAAGSNRIPKSDFWAYNTVRRLCMFAMLAVLVYLLAMGIPIYLLYRFQSQAWYWHTLSILAAVAMGFVPIPVRISETAVRSALRFRLHHR